MLKSGQVVVAGGLNTDILSRPHAALRLGTSNPAHTTFAAGGVGRNLAQNLAQLGVQVALLGVVGDDAFGEGLLQGVAGLGVDVSGVLRRSGPTGSYLAVLGAGGELHAGLSSMALTSGLTPEDAAEWPDSLDAAALLILDANLSPALIAFLIGAAQQRGVPVVLEPVSAPKALALRFLLSPSRPLHLISPDKAELAALSGAALMDLEDVGAVLEAARRLRQRGTEWVLVTLGKRGSVLVGEGPPLFSPARQAEVLDVTGAGDALLAGVLAARWHAQDWPEALDQGHLCAALTIEAAGAVRADLSPELLHSAWGRPALNVARTFP